MTHWCEEVSMRALKKASVLVLALLLVLLVPVKPVESRRVTSARLSDMISTLNSMLSKRQQIDDAYEDIPPYADVMMSLEWTDPRLVHQNITDFFVVPDKYHAELWLPDVGFSNGRDGYVHRVTEENRSIMLGGSGKLAYISRLSVEVRCLMDFSYYPMDSQSCRVQLQSWRYNQEQLKLKWSSIPYTIETGANFSLPQYDLFIETDKNDTCRESYTATGRGTYSCLRLAVIFRRLLHYYILDIYIPSLMIVLISFMALIIDHNIVPARVGIGSLSVSAMFNISRSFKLSNPAYKTFAANVWIWVCQCFVFAVFIEFGIVNVVNRTCRQDQTGKSENHKSGFFSRSSPAKLVDRISRIIFSASFLLFIVVYWSYFIDKSEYNRTDLPQLLIEKLWTVTNKPIPG